MVRRHRLPRRGRGRKRHPRLLGALDAHERLHGGCRPGRTNLLGAAWTSTHDPDDPSDHAPGTSTNAVAFGPFCPPAQDVDVRLGWTHDRTILHIRNLVRIITGDAAYDSADHCIGIEWKKGRKIDLSDYLAPETVPFLQRLQFKVNGSVVPRIIDIGPRPDVIYPEMMLVELFWAGQATPLDTMVVTVHRADEKQKFNDWKALYSGNTSWTALLPSPPATKPIGPSSSWHAPSRPGAYMHHDAVFDMRSKPVSGGHGHQATYDAGGCLITNGTIAAGTADFVSPESVLDGSAARHRNADVHPYLYALHLDGNPGLPDNLTGWFTESVPSRLSRPCIHQGENIHSYIVLRPTLPTGIAPP